MKKLLSALTAVILILSAVFLTSCSNPIYAKTKTFGAVSKDGEYVFAEVPRKICLDSSPLYGEGDDMTSFLSDLPFSQIVESVKGENLGLKCEAAGTDRVIFTDPDGKSIMMRITNIQPDGTEKVILPDGVSAEGIEGRDVKQINFVSMQAALGDYTVPFPMHMSGVWVGSGQVHTLIASKEEFMKFYEDLPYETEVTEDGFIMKDYIPRGGTEKITVRFVFTEKNGKTEVEIKKG